MYQTAKSHIRASFRDGIWTNLNVGMCENYFGAYLLALGFSEVISGMSAIIPLFIGTFLQLFSQLKIFRLQSLNRRIQLFLLFQSLSFIPLIYLGWIGVKDSVYFFGVLSLYWFSSQSLLPSWNLLISQTVPRRFRLGFFSLRSQICQTSIVFGLILAGIGLYYAKIYGLEKECFFVILGLGFLTRLLSWNEFRFHRDFSPSPEQERILTPQKFLKTMKEQGNSKLILFLFFMYFAIYSSSPYYNPYMLKQLQFNYLQFMIMIAVSFSGRILMSKFIKSFARPKNIPTIFFFSCLGIASTPIWWVVSQNYYFLVLIEILSGCYWAGFEVSLMLIYLEKLGDEERSSLMTYISFINTLAMCLGTVVGGVILSFWRWNFPDYLGLFLISSLLRFVVVFFEPHFVIHQRALSKFKTFLIKR